MSGGNVLANIARGRGAQYYENVKTLIAASGFVYVLLKSAGLEADDALRDYDNLSLLLAAANDEADFTGYTRKVVKAVDLAALPAPDDTANTLSLDFPDWNFGAQARATNNQVEKMVVCYDPDTTAGTDTTLVPWLLLNVSFLTDANAINIIVNALGAYVSQD